MEGETMLIEMISEAALKLMQLYETGMITRTVLDNHMHLKMEFLKYILLHYDNIETDTIESLIGRYENYCKLEPINNLLT